MFFIFSAIILSNSSFCATVNQFFQSPTSPENTNGRTNVLENIPGKSYGGGVAKILDMEQAQFYVRRQTKLFIKVIKSRQESFLVSRDLIYFVSAICCLNFRKGLILIC